MVDAIKTELKDFQVYAKVDAEGKIVDVKPVSSETQFEAYNKKEDYVLAIKQSVKFVKWGNEEAFIAAIPDAAARLDIINRGTSNKANQKIKELLTEVSDDGTGLTFESTEVVDVLEYLQEGPKRQKLSEVEKLINQLRAMKLPEEAIQATVASIIAAQAQNPQTEDSSEEEEEGNE